MAAAGSAAAASAAAARRASASSSSKDERLGTTFGFNLGRPLTPSRERDMPPNQLLTEALIEELLPEGESAVLVQIVEARGLAPMDMAGAADPYVCVQLGSTARYTTTVYGSLDPTWCEEYALPLEEYHEFVVLRVFDEDLVGRDRPMGEVRIPVWEYESDTLHDRWFKLTPGRGRARKLSVSGEIHVRFMYRIADDGDEQLASGGVQPKYDRLVKALVGADLSIARAVLEHLEDTELINTRKGEKCVMSLLTVFQNHTFRATLRLIELCVEREVRDTLQAATIFRRNSLGPTILSKYAMSVGGDYLRELLSPLVANVLKSSKTFEIDPARLKEKQDLERNAQNLARKCQRFVDAIVASTPLIPLELRHVAASLRAIVSKRFPEAVPSALASFFFLRFLCPVIVSPKQYSLLEQEPPSTSGRFLLLIAKALQSMANRADRADQQRAFLKEPYMAALEPFFAANERRVRDFLLGTAEIAGLSDVLPAFEGLDRKRLSKALAFLHAHLHENIDEIVDAAGDESPSPSPSPALQAQLQHQQQQQAHQHAPLLAKPEPSRAGAPRHSVSGAAARPSISAAAPSTTLAAGGASGSGASRNESRSRLLASFKLVVRDLGPPGHLTSSLSAATLRQSLEDRAAAQKQVEARAELRRKSGFLAKLRNRVLYSVRPDTQGSEGDARQLRQHIETLHVRYLALLEDRTRLLVERDTALREVHQEYSATVAENAQLREYVNVLREALVAAGKEPPRLPQPAPVLVAHGVDAEFLERAPSPPSSPDVGPRPMLRSKSASARALIAAGGSSSDEEEAKATGGARGPTVAPPPASAPWRPVPTEVQADANASEPPQVRMRANSVIDPMQMENDRLRNENSRLQRGQAALSHKVTELRQLNGTLRAQVQMQEMQMLKLRNQNLRNLLLRHSLAARSSFSAPGSPRSKHALERSRSENALYEEKE